jgi:hypothetical protein
MTGQTVTVHLEHTTKFGAQLLQCFNYVNIEIKEEGTEYFITAFYGPYMGILSYCNIVSMGQISSSSLLLPRNCILNTRTCKNKLNVKIRWEI